MPENLKSQPEETPEDQVEKILKQSEEEYKRLMEAALKENELYKNNPQEWEEMNKARNKEKELGKRKKRTVTSNEKLKKLLETVEKSGADVNDEETIIDLGRLTVQSLNNLFGEKYGISVPEEKLPPVLPVDTDVAFYAESYKDEQGNKKPLNVIGVGTINHILNGNIISEELSHFYRFNFQPKQDDEWLTHEFFGFLGRKMFQKAVAGGHELSDLNNDEGQEVTGRKMTVQVLRKVRSNIRFLKKQKEEADNPFMKEIIQKDIDEDSEIRKDILKHQRGYEFAFNTDVDKIHDWQKLFSMSNEEVRKRFFTEKPDYSGL